MFKMFTETETSRIILFIIRFGFWSTFVMSFFSPALPLQLLPAILVVFDYVYQINVKMNRLLEEKGLPRE